MGQLGGDFGRALVRMRPGQGRRHYHFERTEEGWSSEAVEWIHEGDGIRREWVNDGTDCDGRLTRTGTDFWDGHSLNGYGFPEWTEPEYSQRDYTAESMGY